MVDVQHLSIGEIAVTMDSDKSFDDVCAEIERLSAERQFRVLAVHDVQATLADKGYTRGPLKIIEVCNAGFAHQALARDVHVSLFMPCKFVVTEHDGRVSVMLGRPSMMSLLLPGSGLEAVAAEVEERLVGVMRAAV
ncbi:MAG TPA: DUF302 domain-containing protein [candidate division Zixibacteria bacterium]|nr:DUF302 domain-containing protein [candidate division Zixibacteria bacterium]